MREEVTLAFIVGPSFEIELSVQRRQGYLDDVPQVARSAWPWP
jgi:hypothetical protein